MQDPQNRSRTSDVHRSRTKAWIVEAFHRLVLRRSYRDIGVSELSRRAGVGRSTFYEHFQDKDDVLQTALTPVLLPLAAAAVGKGENSRVCETLAHLRENRLRTLAMLDGPMRIDIERALARLVREQLAGQAGRDQRRLEWVTAGIAAAMIGVIHAWLARASTAADDVDVATDLAAIGRVNGLLGGG